MGIPLGQATRRATDFVSRFILGSTFENPKGISAISPGLRGTSYPGFAAQRNPTLKGLNPCASTDDATPLGLKMILDGDPG